MPEEPQNKSLYSKDHFLKAVRKKYPEYADKPDNVVLGDYLTKFPQYNNQIDWGAEEKKKGVQDPYESPSGFTASEFASDGGSSGTANNYKTPDGFTVVEFASQRNAPAPALDLFPDIYHKVKQMETIFTEADQASAEGVDVSDLIKSGQIVYTNEKGEPCAVAGARNVDFAWGCSWEIVKDLKGMPSHAQGGVDLNISDDGVRFKNNEGKEIHAAHGLLIPDDKRKKKRQAKEQAEADKPMDEPSVEIKQQSENGVFEVEVDPKVNRMKPLKSTGIKK